MGKISDLLKEYLPTKKDDELRGTCFTLFVGGTLPSCDNRDQFVRIAAQTKTEIRPQG